LLLGCDNPIHLFVWELMTRLRLRAPNERSALDARTAFCFHFEAHWPGASESERYAQARF
jgi:hypothetical protein